MGHPDEMKDKGVGGHPDSPLAVRPSQELISLMLKHGCPEDALLAITDRTGNHAVVTSNTGRKFIQKSWQILDNPAEFLEESISFLYSLSNDFIDHLVP